MWYHDRAIVLASASPRRVQLLQQMGIHHFTVQPANVCEQVPQGTPPAQMVQMLAQRKAMHVAAETPDALVIGADTVVCYEDQILGKPRNRDEAAQMLRRLSGRTHSVYTGVCVACNGCAQTAVEQTRVTFANVSEAALQYYLQSGEADDKAGAYGIQGFAAVWISAIEGSYSNVVGLPIHRLAVLLEQFNGGEKHV